MNCSETLLRFKIDVSGWTTPQHTTVSIWLGPLATSQVAALTLNPDAMKSASTPGHVGQWSKHRGGSHETEEQPRAKQLAHAPEPGRGWGCRVGCPRWRTADVGCTGTPRPAHRSVTPTRASTASTRLKRSPNGGRWQRFCANGCARPDNHKDPASPHRRLRRPPPTARRHHGKNIQDAAV